MLDETTARDQCKYRARDLNGSCERINEALGWDSQCSLDVCTRCLAVGPNTSDAKKIRQEVVNRVLLTVERTLAVQTPEVKFEFLRDHCDAEKRVRLGYGAEPPIVPDKYPSPPPEVNAWLHEYAKRHPCNVAGLVKRHGIVKADGMVPGLLALDAWGRRVAEERHSAMLRGRPSTSMVMPACGKC